MAKARAILRGPVALWWHNRTKIRAGQILSTGLPTFRRNWRRAAGSAFLLLSFSVPVAAQELIRCPDWQSLVRPAVLLTATERAGQGSFDARLRASRPASSPAHLPRSSGTGRAGEAPVQTARAAGTGASCSHTVRSGDTLGTIAARKLGTSKRWPEIARANPGVKPDALRIGTVLTLPCAASATQTATQTKGQGGDPDAPLSGTGFLAALFGTKTVTPTGAGGTSEPKPAKSTRATTKPEEKSAAQAQKKAGSTAQTARKSPPTTSPATPTPKPNPPLPIWTARKGEDFAAVLQRWSRAAGHRVVVATTDAWTISVPVRLQADFETAIGQLVQGLGSDGKAPPVRIYQNKVVRLGGLP